jgi:hypothetical protein
MITKLLVTDSYESTRNKILTIVNNFRKKLPQCDLEMEEISKISDTRTRYTATYVYFAQKRIIQLFRLERKGKKDGLKAFKSLLLKERLERRENIPFTYSPKYKKFLKKTI